MEASAGARCRPRTAWREAAQIAKAWKASGRGGPLKVVWTREDDIRGGYYRPMHVHRVEIGYDDKGRVLAWKHTIVGQSILMGTPFELFRVKNGVDAVTVEGVADTPYVAVQKSGYGRKALPRGHAFGVAVHESFDTVVAYVVEASVQDGQPVLHKVTAGVHCNTAVNPLAVEAQVPPIDVHIVPSTEPPTGVGEPGLPPLAPAFANAVAKLTGRPLRELPLRMT